MLGQGFSRSQYDSCVYFKEFSNGSFVYLLLYVDDMLIASPDMSLVEKLKSQLSNEFEMKDIGAAKKILGMEIHRDRQAGKLYLSQKKYVEKVLDRFNMSNCMPVSTPLGAHFKLSSDSCAKSDVDVAYMSKVPYSSGVGTLMYAMVCTRPDLAYAIFTLCNCAISWKATLQFIAALSTTEAEYIATTKGVKEATWLRGLVMELGVSQGHTVTFSDSQSAIHLTKNDTYHAKTKHIDVRYHFIQDVVVAGDIVVQKVHTLENPADMLTKSLPITKFEQCLNLVRCSNC
nr:Retrovirus-related Pol polyprotein from transposon TNT 1-94 [Ipomoea batatas]